MFIHTGTYICILDLNTDSPTYLCIQAGDGLYSVVAIDMDSEVTVSRPSDQLTTLCDVCMGECGTRAVSGMMNCSSYNTRMHDLTHIQCMFDVQT